MILHILFCMTLGYVIGHICYKLDIGLFPTLILAVLAGYTVPLEWFVK